MDRTKEYVYYNRLYDLYGNLLTDREKEIFTLFYEEDLSLQEIAVLRKVSKSAVGKTITTIETKLNDYEDKIGMLKQQEQLLSLVEEIKEIDLKEKFIKVMKG